MSVADLFSIKGKVAIVTGGSRGIGRMIARGFVEAGARVYISARKVQACEETAAELSAIGECIAVPADLGTLEGVEHLVKVVSEREPAVHVLVNNAGATWGAPVKEEFPDAGWGARLGMAINVWQGRVPLTAKLLAATRSRRRRRKTPRASSTSGPSTAFACRSSKISPTRQARQRCTCSRATWRTRSSKTTSP